MRHGIGLLGGLLLVAACGGGGEPSEGTRGGHVLEACAVARLQGHPEARARAPAPVPAPSGREDRRVLRAGGGAGCGPRSLNAVDKALRWLAAHQSPHGGWEAAGFDAWCDGQPHPPALEGRGLARHDAGATGLALLAFLGAGHTNRGRHPFAKVVARGLRHLKNVQDAEGCFGPRDHEAFLYDHAWAALAMLDAYAQTSSPIFKGSAQRGLNFLLGARPPGSVWYAPGPGGRWDATVTGWAALGVFTAHLLNEDRTKRGLPPPIALDPSVLEDLRRWAEDVHALGALGRAPEGTGVLAAAAQVRMLGGERPVESPALQEMAARLLHQPLSGEAPDYAAWLFTTQVLYRYGQQAWRAWSARLRPVLSERQRPGTDWCAIAGSWDPAGPWGREGGRVVCTALGALSLEIYYRYDRVIGAR